MFSKSWSLWSSDSKLFKSLELAVTYKNQIPTEHLEISYLVCTCAYKFGSADLTKSVHTTT
jgi:hypothetical protein